MLIEIKNRWTDAVIFSHNCDDNTISITVTKAVEQGVSLRAANLRAANLSDADLSAADLRDANLRDANLSAADLHAADLRAANLRAANLRAANLSDANLSAADLRAANLRDANLSDANLSAADLRDANLRDANLSAADLTYVRDDIWAILSSAPREVPDLILSLKEGRVDGSTYQGECACLVGTLANSAKVSHVEIKGLKPDHTRPAERFFMGIRRGDTPETNQVSALALQWSEEWLTNMQAAFGQQSPAQAVNTPA